MTLLDRFRIDDKVAIVTGASLDALSPIGPISPNSADGKHIPSIAIRVWRERPAVGLAAHSDARSVGIATSWLAWDGRGLGTGLEFRSPLDRLHSTIGQHGSAPLELGDAPLVAQVARVIEPDGIALPLARLIQMRRRSKSTADHFIPPSGLSAYRWPSSEPT